MAESVLGEAWVMVSANIGPVTKTLTSFFDTWAKRELVIVTRADTAQVTKSFGAVKDMARDLKPVIALAADGAAAMKAVEAVKVAAAETKAVMTLGVNTAAAVKAVDALEVMASEAKPIVTLGVDAVAAVKKIDALEVMARDAHPTMVVKADTAGALAQVRTLRAEAGAAVGGAVVTGGAARSGAGTAAATEGEAAAGGAAGGMLGGGMLGQLKGFAEILGVLEGIHGIASAAKDTQQFQTRLVDLSTGAGEATKNLGMISSGLLSMSTQVGVSAIELEKGLYYIESDGMHGADGLNVLRAAAEGARTGLANMEDVTTGLMTVMRSYEIPASKAAQTTSALVEAVAHGGVRLTDFAQGMKTVAPVAAAFNVPLSQVMGAMSTMTSITHNAATSATGLRYLLNTFAAPSNVASAALDQIGIHGMQLQQALHDQGLVGALKLVEQHLSQTFPGDAVKANAVLHDLFGGTRGMSAGLELTNTHLQEMIANIGDITAKTNEAGNSVAGWSSVQKTLSYQVDVIRAGLVRFGIQAGTIVLPGVTLLLRGVVGLAHGIGAVLGGAIDLVRPAWDALVKGFDATPGQALGGGLLGWLASVGAKVRTVASDISSVWKGVTSALGGTPAGSPVPTGIAGRVAGAVSGVRATASTAWGDLVDAFHGRPFDAGQRALTGAQIGFRGPGSAGQLRDASTARSSQEAGLQESPVARAASVVGSGLRLASLGFSGKIDTSGITGWQKAVVEAGKVGRRAFDDVKGALSGMVSGIKDAVGWGMKHKQLLGDLALGMGVVVGAIVAVRVATEAWRVATEAMAFAQALLNGAMDANPVGLIVVGLGLLVGGLIYAYQHVGWFRDFVKDAFGVVEKVGTEIWSVLSDAIHAFTEGPLKWIQAQIGKFSDLWHEKSGQIMEIWRAVWAFVSTEFKVAWLIFSTELKIALDWLQVIWHFAWDFIKNDFKLVWGAIRDYLTFFIDLIKNTVSLFIDVFTGKWGKVWDDAKKLVSDAFGDIVKFFSDFAKNALNLLYNAGKDIINGMIKGLTEAGSAVWGAVSKIAGSILDGVKHFFGIKSPSTVMAGLGGHIIGGLIQGILRAGSGMAGILDKIFAGALDDPWSWLEHHLADLGGLLDKVPGLASGLASRAASGVVGALEHPSRIGNLFDTGGILPPGASLAINHTGANERTAVFTPAQWADIHSRGLAGGTPNITLHAQVYLGDREITDIVRQEAQVVVDRSNNGLASALRGGTKGR